MGDKKFVMMADKFINIDDLNINLIDTINPFQKAFEVLSKSVTPNVLRLISDTIATNKIVMTPEEALTLYPKIKMWVQVNGRKPERRTEDATERTYAEALLILQKAKREREQRRAAAGQAPETESQS